MKLKYLFEKLVNENNFKLLFFVFFLLFLSFYLFNFYEFNNLSSNDFRKRYKPNGILIVNQIINFDFININFLNSHLVPELITGILIKIFPDDLLFSIASNFLNIILLFSSIYIFFKSLNIKNNLIFLIFFLIFFSYKPNWIYCFRKLPDIYFLFNFSLVFYFIIKSLKSQKTFYIWLSLIFSIISLFVRPQGILNIALVFIFLIFFFKNNKNIFTLINTVAVTYIILYPFMIFSLAKLDQISFFSNILSIIQSGQIYYDIYYTKDDFYKQFSIPSNAIFEIFYYYFLFFKKFIYQITFLRESYSFNHNLFLVFYSSFIYILLIFFFDELLKKYKIFFELTYVVSILSLLFHSSLFIGGEPNRYQLFHLTPLYILVSLSIPMVLEIFLKNKMISK